MSLNIRRTMVWLVWAGFMSVSAWATWEVGYIGVFQSAFQDAGTIQVFADLCVACSLGSAWLHKHATTRGRNPWPWLLAVLPLGSIPLITYAAWSLLPAQSTGASPLSARSS